VRAGRLRYEWRRQGQTLSLADATIAAVAIHHSLILLTDNRRHFPMPELSMHPLPA
jgi:predicted nucleic acid-binding protein